MPPSSSFTQVRAPPKEYPLCVSINVCGAKKGSQISPEYLKQVWHGGKKRRNLESFSFNCVINTTDFGPGSGINMCTCCLLECCKCRKLCRSTCTPESFSAVKADLKQTYYEVIHYHSICNNKRLETTQRIINEKLSKKKKKKKIYPCNEIF